MRIGQVSEKYNIPIERLHYYIKLGIIVPERPNKQYFFSEKSLNDLQLLLRLKKLGFSLKEIHQTISMFRISKFVDSQDRNDLIRIYEQKKNNLILKKEELESSIMEIQAEIDGIVNQRCEKLNYTGVPLRLLSLLACPICQISIELKNVEMNQRYIWAGDIECKCGYHASIKQGILYTPNKNTSLYDKPDLSRELYKDLPPSLITLFQRSYNWMVDKLCSINLKDMVIAETNINAYFFLQQHLHVLDPQGMYIIIDKFPETLLMYKELIDSQGIALDILYIADNSTLYPIKKGCIDLFIDYFGSNEHCIYNHSWLIADILPYFSSHAHILGTFFYFSGNKSIQKLCEEYPEAYDKNFSQLDFIRNITKSGFNFIDQGAIGWTEKSGNNLAFSFHIDGEKMHLLSFFARKA